ncbi:hypothetical protein JXM67_07795 [candidate division WOR-3 bacterium]|nr:hypothetical protein [candidate division WOR-3 bacterium]
MKKRMEKTRMKSVVALQSPRYQLINWLLLAAGVVAIGLGFWQLWRGSTVLAPILMVLGYCVLVPLALILRLKKQKPKETPDV